MSTYLNTSKIYLFVVALSVATCSNSFARGWGGGSGGGFHGGDNGGFDNHGYDNVNVNNYHYNGYHYNGFDNGVNNNVIIAAPEGGYDTEDCQPTQVCNTAGQCWTEDCD